MLKIIKEKFFNCLREDFRGEEYFCNQIIFLTSYSSSLFCKAWEESNTLSFRIIFHLQMTSLSSKGIYMFIYYFFLLHFSYTVCAFTDAAHEHYLNVVIIYKKYVVELQYRWRVKNSSRNVVINCCYRAWHELLLLANITDVCNGHIIVSCVLQIHKDFKLWWKNKVK